MNRDIIEKRSVPNVFMVFFCTLVAKWFQLYKARSGTVEAVGPCIQEAHDLCNAVPTKSMAEFSEKHTVRNSKFKSVDFTDLQK